MKIYFEDGKLRKLTQLPVPIDYVIDATDGVNENYNMLDSLAERKEDITIYTNSILAFSNRYAWNNELKVPEIYIRAGEHMLFTRIDKLTERILREGFNLPKLYISGEFDDMIQNYNLESEEKENEM